MVWGRYRCSSVSLDFTLFIATYRNIGGLCSHIFHTNIAVKCEDRNLMLSSTLLRFAYVGWFFSDYAGCINYEKKYITFNTIKNIIFGYIYLKAWILNKFYIIYTPRENMNWEYVCNIQYTCWYTLQKIGFVLRVVMSKHLNYIYKILYFHFIVIRGKLK